MDMNKVNTYMFPTYRRWVVQEPWHRHLECLPGDRRMCWCSHETFACFTCLAIFGVNSRHSIQTSENFERFSADGRSRRVAKVETRLLEWFVRMSECRLPWIGTHSRRPRRQRFKFLCVLDWRNAAYKCAKSAHFFRKEDGTLHRSSHLTYKMSILSLNFVIFLGIISWNIYRRATNSWRYLTSK